MSLGYMKLIANRVKQLREQKAWSQSHLAQVSGLSLRTIQRIEKEDSASQESVQALASVFETSTATLLTNQRLANTKTLFSATAVAALIAFLLAYFWSSSSNAENVILDFSASYRLVDVNTDEENLLTIDGSMQLKENESTRLKLNDKITYEISASFLEGEKILIHTNIFDESNGQGLIARPKIVTLNHQEGMIQVGDEEQGELYRIKVTPHK